MAPAQAAGSTWHAKELREIRAPPRHPMTQLWPEFSCGRFFWGGGGPGTQKSKILCTKNSQINSYFCKISFFPAMKSGSEGGGGGVRPHPPETLSC